MFTVRHIPTPGKGGDRLHEAEHVEFNQEEVEGVMRGGLELRIGGVPAAILFGGTAYVMNEAGKTVANYTLPDEPTERQIRWMQGIAERMTAHEWAMARLARYREGALGGRVWGDGHRQQTWEPGGPADPMRGSDEPHEGAPVTFGPHERVTRQKTHDEEWKYDGDKATLGNRTEWRTSEAEAEAEHEKQWGKPPERPGALAGTPAPRNALPGEIERRRREWEEEQKALDAMVEQPDHPEIARSIQQQAPEAPKED